MSTVIAKNVQIGTSGTATNNFTVFQPVAPDGTLRIGNGNAGITTSLVALDSAGNIGIGTTSPVARLDVNGSIKGTITSGTAQNSTSGTFIDFTGIPSWVRRITVMFGGVSTNGTSLVQVQLGAGSVTTSGYNAAQSFTGTGQGLNIATTGFILIGNSAADARYGSLSFTNLSGNIWTCFGSNYGSSSGYGGSISGSITLSGTLDRVRITTVNGTDTFDAGSINILYEG